MTVVKSSFLKNLTAEMAARGYEPMAISIPFQQRVYAYEKAINREMHCYIDFRYMASLKAYDVCVGVGSIEVQSDVERALEYFSARAGGIPYSAATAPPSYVLFNADVFTKPDVGEVLPAKVEQMRPYLDALFSNAVRPIFEEVTDKKKLLSLLLRTDPPFNRFFLSFRVLSIVKLACTVDCDWEPIRSQLQSLEVFLRNDAYIGKYPGSLIDDIYLYFSNNQ